MYKYISIDQHIMFFVNCNIAFVVLLCCILFCFIFSLVLLQSVSLGAANCQRQCDGSEARVSSLKEENLDLKRRMSQKNAEVG
jgi:cell division protein FtsB